jgi:hypothetical protein
VTELADILDTPTEDEVGAELLAGIAKKYNPVTDWHEGAVMRVQYELDKECTFDLVATAVPLMARGVFTDTSDEEWLTLLARYWYQRDRSPAGVVVQEVTLACSAGNGPYNIIADRTRLLATDGSSYIASTGGTLSGGGTLDIDATAESPGAMRGLVSSVADGLPGVTVTAAAVKVVATVPQFGADAETDGALIDRCDARWPDLTLVPEMDRVEKWARAASTEVTRVRLDADDTNPGGVIATLADDAGGVTGGAVTAVQTYIDARLGVTDLVTAQAANNLTINTIGTVTVAAERLEEVQAAADEAWLLYLSDTKIGGKVRRTELTQALMDAGAIDHEAFLNGAGVDGNIDLASDEVPVSGGTLTASLTWVTV